MFFLLPFLMIGVAVLATRGRASSAPAPALAVRGAPSPLLVLDGFLRRGQTPPPPVILCAIAEAEVSGRLELANDIVRAFIEPVVAQHEHAQLAHSFAPRFASPEIPRAERASVPRTPEVAKGDPRAWTNDESAVAMALEAMQNPGGGPIIVPAEQITGNGAAPPVAVSGAFAMRESSASPITSPIPRLPAEQWLHFTQKLAREAPTFEGPRHVGQFRARKDRLIELGIDPALVTNDPDRQLDALAADMADAFEHAKQSGMLREHVRRTIEVPIAGVQSVTASGILGVIQAAGLEGAADWFDNPEDRETFPHTTAAFVRTNGVF